MAAGRHSRRLAVRCGRALAGRCGRVPAERRTLGVLAAPLLLAGVLAGSGAVADPAAAAAGSCQNWTGTQPPTVSGDATQLLSVAVLPGCRAWAVGDDFTAHDGDTGLIERWNGAAWQQVPSPSPGVATFLTGVRAVSPADVWAVGSFTTKTREKPLTLHWDGHTWRQVASPAPGTRSELNGLGVVSANDVWAVGDDFSDSSHDRAVILHWNGTKWSQVTIPALGTGSDLAGVTATSRGNAWAVGDVTSGGVTSALILHWNGRVWSRVTSPHPGTGSGLSGVGASSATNAWAVGSTVAGTVDGTLALHWDGHTWRRVATPNPADQGRSSSLDSVAVPAAGTALAVGGYVAGGQSKTLLLRWNGRTWSQLASPNPAASDQFMQFFAVGASSARDAWAVGASGDEHTFQAFAIHCC